MKRTLAIVGVIGLVGTACAADGVLERCLCVTGANKAETREAVRRYAEFRKAKTPAELHITPDRALWTKVRAEYCRQLNLDGKRGKEVSCLLKAPLDATLRIDSEPIWPEGKMPGVSTNQTYAPTLEWFVPRAPRTKAIQVVFPGGGYLGLSYPEEGLTVATRLNTAGIPAVVVRYRTPRPIGAPKHLSAWQDAQRALRIVRRNAASRGLDPDRIGVMGFSAGGHLTLLCATSSTKSAYPRIDETDDVPCNVQWACPVYPAYVLTDGADSTNKKGGNDDDCTVGPEFAFDDRTPPMLFQHGDADGFAAMGSVKVWQRLDEMGVPAELHTLAMRGHCFYFSAAPGTGSAAWLDRVIDFVKRHE